MMSEGDVSTATSLSENENVPFKQSADFGRIFAACFLPRKTPVWIQSERKVQRTDLSALDFPGAQRVAFASLAGGASVAN
jgi:hypothetical protein